MLSVLFMSQNISSRFQLQFPSLDNCYCKYSYVYGNDWEQVSGMSEGLSARCTRTSCRDSIVIGLPIEATFTSTNPFRSNKSQLMLNITNGRCVRRIAMFVPESSTPLQKFIGWITGKRAEFIDPRIVASSDGRHGK
ncbi:unnamed protein product [Anisakis simplex]|uniref:B9 domain-containing protein 1 n=1 Tax=Anisakis simplex TaxID=6269 RepID=A0A0M3KH02_ANISI|nr:unnamed protein product [Anisakis simplex]